MGSTEPVEMTFTLSRAEFLRANRRGLYSVRTLALLAALIAFSAIGGLAGQTWLFGLAAFYVVFFAVYPYLWPRAVWRRHPNAGVEQTFRFDDDAIHVRLARARSVIEWSYYDEVVETDDAYVLKRQRLQSIIPKRAFPSARDESRFRELVAAHLPARPLRPTTDPARS